MNRFAKLVLVAASSLISLTAWAEDIAIVGGTVHTMIGDPIENGTVLVRNGRITAVGADLEAPNGYQVIDATGKNVTPGFMNAFTNIGIVEVGAVDGSNDTEIEEVDFNAAFDVSYAVNPRATSIPVTRVEGVTRAVVAPSVGDSIWAGRGAIIHTGIADDIVMAPRAFMMAALGESGAGQSGGSRGGAMVALINAIEEAADYRDSNNKDDWEGSISRLDAQALIPVTTGDVPLLIRAHRASDITQIIQMGQTYSKLDIVIVGGAEAWMVADALAQARIPVIVHPLDNLPMSFEALASTQRNAGRLANAGVTVAIGSVAGFAGHQARLAPQLAGNAVANGMAWEDALRALTVNPAMIFGIDADYGPLAKGRLADIVIWDGDPLELMVSPDMVMINGEIMPQDTRQTKLRDRYMTLTGEKPFAYRK